MVQADNMVLARVLDHVQCPHAQSSHAKPHVRYTPIGAVTPTAAMLWALLAMSGMQQMWQALLPVLPASPPSPPQFIQHQPRESMQLAGSHPASCTTPAQAHVRIDDHQVQSPRHH